MPRQSRAGAEAVTDDTLPLEPGHYYCPQCNAQEKSFSVFTTLEGGLRGVCHRASCGYRTGEMSPLTERRAPPGRHSRRYTGEFGTVAQLHALMERMEARFGEDCGRYSCTAQGEPLLHVLSPSGLLRGYVKRAIFWGEAGTGPKTVSYAEDLEQPFLSWHGAYGRPLVLVEDIVSAAKVAAAGACGVALLGNALNAEKVREIARNGGSTGEVVIALDADATALAFEQARKWGMAFRKCRVAILERDLKEEDVADIANILGLGGC
jgi:hypothetical protein